MHGMAIPVVIRLDVAVWMQAHMDTHASFVLKPALNGYGGAISVCFGGLTLRQREGGSKLVFEDEDTFTYALHHQQTTVY